MILGDVLIKLSALCAVIALVAAVRWARGNQASERTFRWAYHGMTATLVFASVMLMVAILRHDFRFEYVIGYSSRDLPLIYLFSAFWAGQQGTYLLWGLLGALIGYFLFRRNAWEPAAVMAFYVPTIGFMHALMLNPEGNPFALAPGVPPDGRGLNPLLQDPWMASHPPAVFLGYAAATIPAVLAMVALIKRREDKWINTSLRWSLVAFVTLGVGIVLGGRLLGLQGSRLGRLLGMGPRRERLSHSVDRGHRAGPRSAGTEGDGRAAQDQSGPGPRGIRDRVLCHVPHT
jgi:cytochrome c-type biogenesis protein CcmF